MQPELTLSLAFLAGLAGAGHCWAMCGGLVGGLFVHAGVGQRVDLQLAYHAGRVLAYSLVGALASGIGQAIVLTGGVGRVQGVLYIVAGLMAVLAGVWAMRQTSSLSNFGIVGCKSTAPDPFLPVSCPMEQPCGSESGKKQPRRGRFSLSTTKARQAASGCAAVCSERGEAHPLMRVMQIRLQPSPTAFSLAGFFNGLMPCALVFSLTLKAATAPTIATGAAWLFVFGLGTLPAMVLAAALAQWLGGQARLWLRRVAGLLVIGLGLEAIWAGAKFFHVMLHL